MFGLNSISSFLFASSEVEEVELPVIKLGDFLWVETMCYGLQLGQVKDIVANPFYGQQGMCAFVVGNGWNDYLEVEIEVTE